MPNLSRIRVVWSGLPGLPGLNTFYVDGADPLGTVQQARTALQAFYTSLNDYLSASVTVTVATEGDVLAAESGLLVGTWSDPTSRTSTGIAVGNVAAGVGAFMRARTASIQNSHRVKGGFYLAPLRVETFGADGLVKPAGQTLFNASAATLLTKAAFYISAAARPAVVSPARPASPYHQAKIVSLSVSPIPTQLRSRAR